MKEIRVSSSWTLFYKIFLPTVWIVFFGVLTIFTLISGGVRSLPYHLAVQGTLVMVLLSGFALLWFTLMDLKRVELTDDCFYVTNYFKTYRYTYDSLKDIRELKFLWINVTVFEFVQKSSFGKKIIFIQRRQVWNEFIDTHPEVFSHLA